VDTSTRNILSLCGGIGGIDLGLGLAIDRARTICFVENEVTAVEILVARMEDGALDQAPVWTGC
jgi:DNA (cytosine-5)-methyltransferase 1